MSADPDVVAAVKKMEQKQFAESQMRELIKRGLSQKEAARVLHAAGPTWCVKAAEWGLQAFDSAIRPLKKGYGGYVTENIPDAEHGFAVVDALDCLLTGAGGRNGFGKERMKRVLRVFNIEPPDGPTNYALFAVLRGAREAIVAAHASMRQNDPLAMKKDTTK